MDKIIGNNWDDLLKQEFLKDYFIKLEKFVDKEYENGVCYPPKEDIFYALKITDYNDVSVVILGQDPYHEEHEAHGLCFSVPEDKEKLPPSLVNIFKEIRDDVGGKLPENGCLERWARQGVLLLNTVLTVRQSEANSHRKQGWEFFTDMVIELIDKKEDPVVFILWGKPAAAKKKLIKNPRHLVLEGPHPSPLSSYRGFFGCKHFSKANEFLLSNNRKAIKW